MSHPHPNQRRCAVVSSRRGPGPAPMAGCYYYYCWCWCWSATSEAPVEPYHGLARRQALPESILPSTASARDHWNCSSSYSHRYWRGNVHSVALMMSSTDRQTCHCTSFQMARRRARAPSEEQQQARGPWRGRGSSRGQQQRSSSFLFLQRRDGGMMGRQRKAHHRKKMNENSKQASLS